PPYLAPGNRLGAGGEDGSEDDGDNDASPLIAAAIQAGYLKGDKRTAVTNPDEDDARLTDEDLFALLVRNSMGGVSAFTWDAYCSTPDRILRDSYCAEFDEDYHLVT